MQNSTSLFTSAPESYVANPLICEDCCRLAAEGSRSQFEELTNEFGYMAKQVFEMVALYFAVIAGGVCFLFAAIFPELLRSHPEDPLEAERREFENAAKLARDQRSIASAALSKLKAQRQFCSADETSEEDELSSAWNHLGSRPAKTLDDIECDRSMARRLAAESERIQRDNIFRAELRTRLDDDYNYYGRLREQAHEDAAKAAGRGDFDYSEKRRRDGEHYERMQDNTDAKLRATGLLIAR